MLNLALNSKTAVTVGKSIVVDRHHLLPQLSYQLLGRQ